MDTGRQPLGGYLLGMPGLVTEVGATFSYAKRIAVVHTPNV